MTFDLSTINFETATCRDLAALPALAPRSHDNLFSAPVRRSRIRYSAR
jgi:hypothetical protein